MKSIIILFLVTGVCVAQDGIKGVLSFAPADQTTQRVVEIGNTEDILSLKLTVKPEKFKVGEPLYCEYTLENISTNAVYILNQGSNYSMRMVDRILNKEIASRMMGFERYISGDSYILLKPSECYTYTPKEPIIIDKNTNGYYIVHFGDDIYKPASISLLKGAGFIIEGTLSGSFPEVYSIDFPLENWYKALGFDASVPLYNGFYEIWSDNAYEYVYDDEYFHRRELKEGRRKKCCEQEMINGREIECTRFEKQDELFSYVTDYVRIEVKRSALIDALNDAIKAKKYKLRSTDDALILLNYLQNTQGWLKRKNLHRYVRPDLEPLLSDLLVDGQCQVYDLTAEEYIGSCIAAERYVNADKETVFILKSDGRVFFEGKKREDFF